MSGKPPAIEMRKIQLTGGSTYIVSLPKDWVRRMGLERGSVVGISKLDDLSLRIQPRAADLGEKAKKATITVSEKESPESLVRKMVSAYLLGYSIIQIYNPKNRLEASQRYAVKDFTRRKLVGTEILSELPQELTLQVLLSYSDLSVKDALRRMTVIAASMHRDAITALSQEEPGIAREIISMDDEVDRFSFYIIRLLKVAVSDNLILRESGLKSPRECLGYRLITKSVERMADHAVSIANNSLALTMSNISEEVMEELKGLSDSALNVFEASIDALFDNDYDSANTVMDKAEETREMEAGVIQKIIKNVAPEDVPSLRMIVESILRTAEYGADVAEVVLNLTIRDEILE
jgi:phosphate uptake regulator